MADCTRLETQPSTSRRAGASVDDVGDVEVGRTRRRALQTLREIARRRAAERKRLSEQEPALTDEALAALARFTDRLVLNDYGSQVAIFRPSKRSKHNDALLDNPPPPNNKFVGWGDMSLTYVPRIVNVVSLARRGARARHRHPTTP